MGSGDSQREQRTLEETLCQLVRQVLGVKVEAIRNIGGGVIGQVFAVFAEHERIAVKVGVNEEELPFDQESNDNRVYGVRWSNLQPSHDLLAAHNILAPKIHSIGEIENGTLHYVIMELLEGESVREYLANPGATDPDQLHAVVGEAFGKMHGITRHYQGWTAMTKPYATTWKEAFFESLSTQIRQARQKSSFIRDNLKALDDFVERRYRAWSDPEGYVFTHTDGFQGIAKYEQGQWKFGGLVDIEDNQFTDQRFALTGYELALNRPAPESFWNSYKEHMSIPESYQSHKGLFEMFYLLSWLPTSLGDDEGGKLEGFEKRLTKCLEEFSC